MKIDLHIHTKTGSDGALPVEAVFREAQKRNINFMSITDHDSIDCQARAITLAKEGNITYITGVELNVTFPYPPNGNEIQKKEEAYPRQSNQSPPHSKVVSLDFLGYQYEINNVELNNKLRFLREYREIRARQILEKLNIEFEKEKIAPFTEADIKRIQENVDGAFGRPHIADYLVKKGMVRNRQEAFDKYLVKCDVPKFPLTIAEASRLIRCAGGILVLAHPNDPNGTSLATITSDLSEQRNIIEQYMLEYIDGVECWHPRNNTQTTKCYIELAKKHGLFMTGGSDCHQKPLLLGTLNIPDYVAKQFRR